MMYIFSYDEIKRKGSAENQKITNRGNHKPFKKCLNGFDITLQNLCIKSSRIN